MFELSPTGGDGATIDASLVALEQQLEQAAATPVEVALRSG